MTALLGAGLDCHAVYNFSCKHLQVICHGIPDSRPLVEGDIVNLDVSVYYKGFHGDLNETFIVGQTTDDASKKLVKAAHDVSRIFLSNEPTCSQANSRACVSYTCKEIHPLFILLAPECHVAHSLASLSWRDWMKNVPDWSSLMSQQRCAVYAQGNRGLQAWDAV